MWTHNRQRWMMEHSHTTASLQSPQSRKMLVQQLKPVLATLYKSVHARFTHLSQLYYDSQQQPASNSSLLNFSIAEYVASQKMVAAYRVWKANMRNISSELEHEFCLQTAAMHFVHIFFVNVCKDYGLFPHHVAGRLFARHQKRRSTGLVADNNETYLQFLDTVYQKICEMYPHFGTWQELYSWFIPDKQSIRALFTLLDRYDFKGLSLDILGRVYSESFIEHKARSEKGQFYTPSE